MSVPQVMPSPRQLIHRSVCDPQRRCRFDSHGEASAPCKKLDELLDFNDEMVLHEQAREIFAEMQRYAGKRGAMALLGGLSYAAEMTDPYEKINAFEGDIEEYVHPGEERPDCPSCVAGKEHYHRKSDGSPVVSPDRQQNGTT